MGVCNQTYQCLVGAGYTILQLGFFLEPKWVSPGFWPIPPSVFSLVCIHVGYAYGFLFVELCELKFASPSEFLGVIYICETVLGPLCSRTCEQGTHPAIPVGRWGRKVCVAISEENAGLELYSWDFRVLVQIYSVVYVNHLMVFFGDDFFGDDFFGDDCFGDESYLHWVFHFGVY